MFNFLIPVAYAATDSVVVNNLLNNIIDNIVYPLVYLTMAVSVLYFLWGIMTFVQQAGDSAKRQEGYNRILWGIIGLFIMISARGIIGIILSTMGL